MYTISKQFEFSASHQLSHLADDFPDHQCARLHGHNYMVTVELKSSLLNGYGFVVDYGELKEFKELLDAQFDHRHLNEVLGSSEMTTAENLARHFYMMCKGRWKETVAVTVSETPKTKATYREYQPAIDFFSGN